MRFKVRDLIISTLRQQAVPGVVFDTCPAASCACSGNPCSGMCSDECTGGMTMCTCTIPSGDVPEGGIAAIEKAKERLKERLAYLECYQQSFHEPATVADIDAVEAHLKNALAELASRRTNLTTGG